MPSTNAGMSLSNHDSRSSDSIVTSYDKCSMKHRRQEPTQKRDTANKTGTMTSKDCQVIQTHGTWMLSKTSYPFY